MGDVPEAGPAPAVRVIEVDVEVEEVAGADVGDAGSTTPRRSRAPSVDELFARIRAGSRRSRRRGRAAPAGGPPRRRRRCCRWSRRRAGARGDAGAAGRRGRRRGGAGVATGPDGPTTVIARRDELLGAGDDRAEPHGQAGAG